MDRFEWPEVDFIQTLKCGIESSWQECFMQLLCELTYLNCMLIEQFELWQFFSVQSFTMQFFFTYHAANNA